jgi:hypothetical protein
MRLIVWTGKEGLYGLPRKVVVVVEGKMFWECLRLHNEVKGES